MNSARTFASRSAIIAWVNGRVCLEMTKIEQLGSGVIYCLLLDSAFPKRVPLWKLKWNASTETDYIHNFKILQTCFVHLGIQKKIDISKLTKAKYQDNLELIQWFKWFIENDPRQTSEKYDALARRQYREVDLGFCEFEMVSPGRKSSASQQNKKVVSQKKIYPLVRDPKKSKYKYRIPDSSDKQFFQIFQCRAQESPIQEPNEKFVQERVDSGIMVKDWKFGQSNKLITGNDKQNHESLNSNLNSEHFLSVPSKEPFRYSSPKQIKRFYFPERFSQRLKRRVDILNCSQQKHGFQEQKNCDNQ